MRERVTVTIDGPSYHAQHDAPRSTDPRSLEWRAFVRLLRAAIDHARQLEALEQREARERDSYLGQLTAAGDRCRAAEKIDSLDEGPPVSYPCQLPAGHEGAHRHGRRMWS